MPLTSIATRSMAGVRHGRRRARTQSRRHPGWAGNWLNDHTVHTHGFAWWPPTATGAAGRGRCLPSAYPADRDPPRFEPRIISASSRPTIPSSVVAGQGPRVSSTIPTTPPLRPEEHDPCRSGCRLPFPRQAAYAVSTASSTSCLSDAVGSGLGSSITARRSSWVQRVAPWLTSTATRIRRSSAARCWIVDGYTTRANYPTRAGEPRPRPPRIPHHSRCPASPPSEPGRSTTFATRSRRP